MDLKNIYGDVIFALEGAKTILELVTAAYAANKSLRDAVLSGADLRGAVLRDAVLRDESLDGIPLIPNIHQAVYEAASKPDALDMGDWHKCVTTHCRAGWVVALAGPGGKALEWSMGTPAAAAVIYMRSDPKLERIPNFYADNETALEDMERLAKAEAGAQ